MEGDTELSQEFSQGENLTREIVRKAFNRKKVELLSTQVRHLSLGHNLHLYYNVINYAAGYQQ